MDFLQALSNILLLVGIGLVFALAWGFSILAVITAVQRRALPGLEKFFWVALAAVLPLAGGLIYLFSGPLDRWIAADRRQAQFPRLTTATQLPGVEMPAHPVATVAFDEPGSQPVRPTARAGSQWRVRVLEGPDAGQAYTLTGLPVRVGRGDTVFIVLAGDQRVSRQHAELYTDGHALRLRDLGSLHGTTLNGRRILDEALRPGDRVRVGDTIMVIEYG